MNKDYKITRNTQAICPFHSNNSIIFENRRRNVINNNPNKIIRYNCIRNGSTFEGRLENTKNQLGYSYKAPIVVREKDNLIFFPTVSPRLKRVAWINYNNIEDYFPDDNNKCIIRFFGGNEVKLDVSFFVISSQIYKSAKLYRELIKKDLIFV